MHSSTTNQFIEETCIICEQPKLKGIHLYTKFICSDCEKDIIQTDTDNPKYRFYLQQLKKIRNKEIYS
ncbi:MAG TPA: sigma factor G inhibitor Gin [Anoxybacillus sp.]|jgi:hypothetical protein|nr:sigma factor G inhibitor Gin [Anoxybacillus sp.]